MLYTFFRKALLMLGRYFKGNFYFFTWTFSIYFSAFFTLLKYVDCCPKAVLWYSNSLESFLLIECNADSVGKWLSMFSVPEIYCVLKPCLKTSSRNHFEKKRKKKSHKSKFLKLGEHFSCELFDLFSPLFLKEGCIIAVSYTPKRVIFVEELFFWARKM